MTVAPQWSEVTDPRTGELVRSGDRPPDGVRIEVDRNDPYVLICALTTAGYVRRLAEVPH